MTLVKNEHVLSTKLAHVVADDEHITKIRDAVERVHRITIDATELLSLHISRCLEDATLTVPKVDASFIKMVMMEVTE